MLCRPLLRQARTIIELLYPSATFATGGVAQEINGDTVTCACGNHGSYPRRGPHRLVFLNLGEAPLSSGSFPKVLLSPSATTAVVSTTTRT